MERQLKGQIAGFLPSLLGSLDLLMAHDNTLFSRNV